MNHDEKVEHFVAEMKSRGYPEASAAPPAFRKWWAAGKEIPPPLFLPFGRLVRVLGAYWGVRMFLIFLVPTAVLGLWFSTLGMTLAYAGLMLAVWTLGGLAFGLLMAFAYRHGALRLGLPAWEDYPTADAPMRSTPPAAACPWLDVLRADAPRPRWWGIAMPLTMGLVAGLIVFLASSKDSRDYDFLREADDEAIWSLASTTDPLMRFYALGPAAEAALRRGRPDEARLLAVEMLDQAPQYPDDWNFGNAIHTGHIVLGTLALREDDVDEAKHHLAEAGRTPGSPQLHSFGPNMSLARDLLERGEPDAVLAYLEACRVFWAMEDGRLDAWAEAIQAGDEPDFGRSLIH